LGTETDEDLVECVDFGDLAGLDDLGEVTNLLVVAARDRPSAISTPPWLQIERTGLR